MRSILAVYDEMGWAFWHHCRELQKRLTEYKIDIVDHRQNIPEMSKQYDVTYILDPMPLPYGYPPSRKTILGLRNEFLYKEHPNGAKGLYLDGFPGRCVSLNRCEILHMVNKNQIVAFKDIATCKLVLCQHGVDEELFDRKKHKKPENSVLTVGVVGRNSYNKNFEIIRDACSIAKVNLVWAQYGHRKVAKEDMPKFYNSIDVYCCASLTEGLQNPLLEACAMGVPCVSTKCGAAEDIIVDDISGILVERHTQSIADALEKLKDKELRLAMGDKFYSNAEHWTWKTKIEDFRKMFALYFSQHP